MKLYQRTGEVVHDLQNMKIGCTSSSRHFSIKKKFSVSSRSPKQRAALSRGKGGGRPRQENWAADVFLWNVLRRATSACHLTPRSAAWNGRSYTGNEWLEQQLFFSLVPANDVSVQLSVEFTAPLLFQLTRIISFRRKVHSFKWTHSICYVIFSFIFKKWKKIQKILKNKFNSNVDISDFLAILNYYFFKFLN